MMEKEVNLKKFCLHVFTDETGNVISMWSFAWGFTNGRAIVQDYNGKWGLIDRYGNILAPCQWQHTILFREGLAAVQDDNGKWGYINTKGELVIPCIWNKTYKFIKGRASVQDANGKWGYIIWFYVPTVWHIGLYNDIVDKSV